MKARQFVILIASLVLIAGVVAGVFQAIYGQPALRTVTELENVRSYTVAPHAGGLNYAVDGGVLFAGAPGEWVEVSTPRNVIVAVAAVDAGNPQRLYIGAANELAVYRSTDAGARWQRIPLVDENTVMTGGVIALAVDPVQHLVYAGTDTAGLFRLRDVGSSLTLTAHLLTRDAVREIAVDTQGKGVLFARTDWTLYRGENYGLVWVTVDSIGSPPTALAVSTGAANETPAVYVGTVDRGVLRSFDGHNWATANHGLNFVPGSRLYVDALAVDPVQPETLYVATSYLYGSTTVHHTPSSVFMAPGAAATEAVAWTQVGEALPTTAAALLPVAGQPGAVFALTTTSRAPVAMGETAELVATAPTAAPVVQPAAGLGVDWTTILAWIIAALAAAALVFAVVTDVRRRPQPAARPNGRLAEQPVMTKEG